jgi:hypothetical protein
MTSSYFRFFSPALNIWHNTETKTIPTPEDTVNAMRGIAAITAIRKKNAFLAASRLVPNQNDELTIARRERNNGYVWGVLDEERIILQATY